MVGVERNSEDANPRRSRTPCAGRPPLSPRSATATATPRLALAASSPSSPWRSCSSASHSLGVVTASAAAFFVSRLQDVQEAEERTEATLGDALAELREVRARLEALGTATATPSPCRRARGTHHQVLLDGCTYNRCTVATQQGGPAPRARTRRTGPHPQVSARGGRQHLPTPGGRCRRALATTSSPAPGRPAPTE